MHMSLSSGRLPNLNRQLQFVTYTNTLFHPSTADTGLWRFLNSFHFLWDLLTSVLFHISVRLQSEGHRALFSIRIRHGVTPKLYNTGSNGGNQMADIHRAAQSCALSFWPLTSDRLFRLCRVQHQRSCDCRYKDFPAVRQASRSYQQHQKILSYRHHSDR